MLREILFSMLFFGKKEARAKLNGGKTHISA